MGYGLPPLTVNALAEPCPLNDEDLKLNPQTRSLSVIIEPEEFMNPSFDGVVRRS